MLIKDYDMLQFEKTNGKICSFSFVCLKQTEVGDSIFFLRGYLSDYFVYVRREGVLNYIENHPYGVAYDMVNFDIDHENNLVYLSAGYYNYIHKPKTSEIEALLESESFIQLCKMKFLEYCVLTKENFVHILLLWDSFINDSVSFVLLYEDDQGWFDVKPFQTKEEMEQFVAQHSK